MFETQVTKRTTRPSAFIPWDRKCLSQLEENKILAKDMSWILAWMLHGIQKTNRRSLEINSW